MDLDSGRLVALNVRVDDRNVENLDSPGYVENFIRSVVKATKMEILVEPQSVLVPKTESSVDDPIRDDGGLTTQCIITTSHIAYHSWPCQRRFRLVVDSCKNFAIEDVLRVVHWFFPVKEMSVQDLPYLSPNQGYWVGEGPGKDYGHVSQTQAQA